MKKIIDNFENKVRYKLYRTIPEIIHPSISKKNISNYKIVLEDKLIPIRVFYPEMVSNIDNVIIYIHGENNSPKKGYRYGDISRLFAKELKCLVISIDYDDDGTLKKLVKNIFPTCKYIVDEFSKLKAKTETVIRAVNILDNASENAAENMQVATETVSNTITAIPALLLAGLSMYGAFKACKYYDIHKKMPWYFYVLGFSYYFVY